MASNTTFKRPRQDPHAKVLLRSQRTTAMYITGTTVYTMPGVSGLKASVPSILELIGDLVSGNQIGDASCDDAVDWGGSFLNPWNALQIETQPSITPCSSTSSSTLASATCYHAANPDACPCQYEVGWCYCNNLATLYPIMTGSDPCGYTVLPTTTTTSPVCTATECQDV